MYQVYIIHVCRAHTLGLFLTFIKYKNRQLLASLNMVLLFKKLNPMQNYYVKYILCLFRSDYLYFDVKISANYYISHVNVYGNA